MKHVIAYPGLVGASLGIMQEEYVDTFLPWPNKRIGIEGTLLRPPYTRNNFLEWLREIEKQKGSQELFAVLQHTGTAKRKTYRYVGHMGLHAISLAHGFAATGSVIGDARGRGNGCGTEAKLLLEYHAFMVLGLRKLTSGAKVFNGNSIGHLMKCGYKPIGRWSKHHLHEGTHVDEVLLEVFREDWEPIWERYQATKELPHLTEEQRKIVAELTTS
jgi:RimJ/RimL family protein N-acetyltransferase